MHWFAVMNVPDLMGYIAFIQAACYTKRLHMQDVIETVSAQFYVVSLKEFIIYHILMV
jgi:hypothetical protein